MVIFNTFNFSLISQYLSQFLKYKNGILGISKQGVLYATQLLEGNVMFTRFKRQYLISAYFVSRAHDLPKFIFDLDPELQFKLFLKEQIIFKNERQPEWKFVRVEHYAEN